MSLDLDALDAAAKAAKDSTTEPWWSRGALRSFHTEADARFIALADPDTIRQLVAIARAAQEASNDLTTHEAHRPSRPLRAILARLDAALAKAGL